MKEEDIQYSLTFPLVNIYYIWLVSSSVRHSVPLFYLVVLSLLLELTVFCLDLGHALLTVVKKLHARTLVNIENHVVLV